MMYMGGNGFYWRIAFHPSRTGVIEVRRTEGVRAWDAAPGAGHLSFSGERSGLWRYSGRAPQRLVGVGFVGQGFDRSRHYLRTSESRDARVAWIFAGIDSDIIGDHGMLQGGAAGIEVDACDQSQGTPHHAIVLARSEHHSNTYERAVEDVLTPHGATNALLDPGIRAEMVFFETSAGGAVFATGSIAFSGALGSNDFDNHVFRVATNVLRRFLDPALFPRPTRTEGVGMPAAPSEAEPSCGRVSSGLVEVLTPAQLTPTRFAADYLRANRPVVVRGELASWPLFASAQGADLLEWFANEPVQVYDSLFGLLDIEPLHEYVGRHFGRPDGEVARAYVRWYAKFRDVDFAWSDHVFALISTLWQQPRFLPRLGYLFPFDDRNEERDAARDPFPFKGIFISGRGARTRLHRDPLNTDAVICQLRGSKQVRFYPPSTAYKLERDGEFYDPDAENPGEFQSALGLAPSHACLLREGDVLFVPGNWYHDARTIADSVSLTWNFVHRERAEPFLDSLGGALSPHDMEVLRYFFGGRRADALRRANRRLCRALIDAGIVADDGA